MNEPSILLDSKHGVNPAVTKCFYCNKDSGLALFGQLTPAMKRAIHKTGKTTHDNGAAPHGLVVDMTPCHECEEFMQQGIILISCREPKDKDEEKNPYRTGGWVVVRDEYIQRVVRGELANHILRARFSFLPDDAWDMLGLPRGEQDVSDNGDNQGEGTHAEEES
jgi:hypothetical protein